MKLSIERLADVLKDVAFEMVEHIISRSVLYFFA